MKNDKSENLLNRPKTGPERWVSEMKTALIGDNELSRKDLEAVSDMVMTHCATWASTLHRSLGT
jgi:hypothetical protein